ncbi:hypothetical protein EIP91_008389 [Steccherinum ochraceum]|uniref:DUF6535 domain-containing protein n=1 Tax=Steccherinum ochraceum TaxID=92696 RepID=A0A4R0R2X7_9APHY|nr:hypothetical protein EIP91_008389 [Steccherinum ochraceum]
MASIHEEPHSAPVRDPRNITEPPESIKLMQELLATLKRSTIVPQDIVDVWARFWNIYKKEADEYDLEFLSRYREDMNTCMIFAGLFTAVTATVASMTISDLSPDPNQTTQALLLNILLVLNSTSGSPPATFPLPAFNGPPTIVIWYQSLLYASIACSLFAALGAVLGIQWLSRYSSVGERGTLEDRCKERQRKFDGLEAWHLRRVLEALSTLLQLSLFLFAAAVCAYMSTQQTIVAAVLISVMGTGAVFYFSTVGLAVIYRDCPFSTPLSESLREGFSVLQQTFRLVSDTIRQLPTTIFEAALSTYTSTLRVSRSGAIVIPRFGRTLARMLLFPFTIFIHYSIIFFSVCRTRGSRLRLLFRIQPSDEEQIQLSHSLVSTSHHAPPGRVQRILAGEVAAGLQALLRLSFVATTYVTKLKFFKARPSRRPSEHAGFAGTSRSPSVAWMLDTSTDPRIYFDTLLLLPQTDWTQDMLRGHLSADMLERLLDPLVRCFESGSDGRLCLPPTNEHRVAQLCDTFLFIYWELHVLDVRAAICWILTSGRIFVQNHPEILDLMNPSSAGADSEGKHMPRTLLFYTLKMYLPELLRSSTISKSRPSDNFDDLWRVMQDEFPTETVPVTGLSHLSALNLHSRILFLMAQLSDRDCWSSVQKQLLKDVIAHCCRSASSREQILTLSVAFVIMLGHKVGGGARSIMTAAQIEQEANTAAVNALDMIVYTTSFEHHDRMFDLVESSGIVFKSGTRFLHSLRTSDVVKKLLNLCSWMHDRQRDKDPRWIRALVNLLRSVIHSASVTEFPHQLPLEGWTPESSDLGWLPTFLKELVRLSGQPNGPLSEDEIQHAAADTFLLLTRGANVDPENENILLAAFDWVTGLPFPDKWSPDTNHTPIIRLQATMIHTVDSAIKKVGDSSDFTSQLQTRIVPSLLNIVAQPAQSLSLYESEDSKTIYERDKSFIATLLSLTPQSSDRESWLNEPANDAYVRAWAHIIHRWLLPDPLNWSICHSRVDELSAVSLLACTRLLQATAADWGDDLLCIQHVAVLAVWGEWDVWYSDERAPEDPYALVERTRRIMELDAHIAVDVEPYLDMVFYLEWIQNRYGQVLHLHLYNVISTLEEKLAEIKELKHRTQMMEASQRFDSNSESKSSERQRPSSTGE